jgi:HlyD family type I secretion membrane fusion protein
MATKHSENRVAKNTPESSLFARQCDKIAANGQKTFIYTIAVGMMVFIVWANLVYLDRVTRGEGRVIPSTANQIVQHLEGGIISQILVKQGTHVKKGDILLRIKNSFSHAENSRVRLELMARRLELKRLDAETRGAEKITFPPAMAQKYPRLIANEKQLFTRRLDRLKEQLLILEDQSNEKKLELEELKARLKNKVRERELVREQVISLTHLVKMGAASTNKLLDKKTALQRIKSAISDLRHQIPRLKSNVIQTGRKGIEARLRFKAEAEKERNEAQLKISKLEETLSAMKDRNRRFDVRAPISGVVNRLAVSTIGGVIKPGQELAEIVPADKAISIEARLSPKDRAEVWTGLPAVIKISAYDYSIHGGLEGTVTEISPDALTDEQGHPYFRVRLEASASDFGPQKPVTPGMLAEVDILTGNHSVMSYLLKPMNRISERALRQ